MRSSLLVGLVVALCLVHPSFQQSCVGHCEDGLVSGAECQCNGSCGNFGDCCSDYEAVCLSCEDRCDIGYHPENECQCNQECTQHGNCCGDFDDFCGDGTGSGSVTNDQLIEWSKALLPLDVNNCFGLYTVDIQGSTSQCSTADQAPGPLFTSFDETIWDKETPFLLRELFDNYDPDVTVVEDNTLQEQAEVSAFLDWVMDSDVMVNAYNFLFDNGVFTGDMAAFRAKIEELWFVPYDRDGTSADVKGSSGFEHVFIGELKEGEISGFHNWLHWYYEEAAGNINYLGWLDNVEFTTYGSGITNVFEWFGQNKCIGGNFIGTSPEIELAVYTVCFLTRGNGDCYLEWEGVSFSIKTYDLIGDNGMVHIGTAYPQF